MKSPPSPSSISLNEVNLISKFCTQATPSKHNILAPYAVEVILMTRISSIRKVAEFMSEVIGKKISTRPVTEMMKKFRNGELNITEEEIRKVAESDPLASKWYQFFEQSPKKPGRVPRKNSAE